MPLLRSFLTSAATFTFLAIQAAAECQLKNVLDSSDLPTVHPELCKAQGAGAWTFSMDVSELAVPSFSAGAPWAGLVDNVAFLIYDESCTLRGVYDPHQNNDCGSPYVIMENFLTYVLTITDVNYSVAGPYFSFLYANGKFSIRNNSCDCEEIGGGLRVEQGCKCAFPVDGFPEMRSVLRLRSVGLS